MSGGANGVVEVAGAVDVAGIEAQLRDLWEQLAGVEQQQESHPVMRACVQNLLVWAPDAQGASAGEAEAAVSQAMVDVTIDHPSRIMVFLPNGAGDRAGELEAWVTAQCHKLGKHQQVCCEQIMVAVGDERREHLPSLVRPLLVADLPTVMWWRAAPAFGEPSFESLADCTERVIIDAERAPRGIAGLIELARAVVGQPASRRVTDLAWSRATPWRIAVAEVFDVEEHRARLPNLASVEIQCDRLTPECGAAAHAEVGAESLLLAGWLASRLGWQPVGAPRSKDGVVELSLSSATGKAVTMRIKPAEQHGADGTQAITLSDGEATFTVNNAGERQLDVVADSPASQSPDRRVSAESMDEGPLLSRELAVLSSDGIYKQVLTFFSELGKE
ncbi:MAG: glucose-6-phosphate dehydrogenase assembly protein OpcA [Myxococcales bacterium]|nr:glucose-6-phosphate dehydrogenase assembly protein OpcA [Myxococcales bacterium]